MPRMSGQNISVAANTTTTNQVAGQIYEFLDRPMRLGLGAAAAAVGINCTLIVGGVAIVNDQPISQANRFPTIPDDVVTKLRNARGRIVLTFRNTTGGAVVVNGWFIDVG